MVTIKLDSKPDDAIEALLDEYWKETAPHPFDRNIRLRDDYIGIELHKFEGKVVVGSIISFMEKNAGNASKVLKWVTALADKHQVTLELDVHPIPNAGDKEGKNLTKAQLKKWYARNGFIMDPEDYSGSMMIRQPSKPS